MFTSYAVTVGMLDLLAPQYFTCIMESLRRFFLICTKLVDNKALLPGTVSGITVLNDCYSFELNLNKSPRAYARV